MNHVLITILLASIAVGFVISKVGPILGSFLLLFVLPALLAGLFVNIKRK